MRIGVDYYPEHWDKNRWKTDAELMRKANIKLIRVGEFAWSLYESEEGKYHFEWMDEILDFFVQYGIKVVLCTPSATPPKWMTDKYPEIFQDDIHGNAKIFGTRRHYCYNSGVYRKKARTLVEMIAERYGKHPGVEAWQIDNELGWANTTRCYCEKCKKKFQNWLQAKYGAIDNLNKKYGTVFWSQIYNSFDEVIIPKAGACYDTCHQTQGQNPALLLDYYRFSSDSVISFMGESAEIIRKYSDKPVTTNMLDASVNSGTGIDYFKMSKDLDFVTWDNYIEFQWGIAKPETVSKDHALLRSYKKKAFWVMEQQSGPCGWSKMGPAPTPGKLRLWTYQAVANGADTVLYFRWRACPFGTEQYWHGILGHDGKVNRRYEEIASIGAEMEKLNAKVGTLLPKPRVAIVKSFDSEWSHSIHSHVEDFHYDKLLQAFYEPLYKMGIAADFVTTTDEDLSQYCLVIAPALLMVKENEKRNLEQFAANGGKLVITFRSGIKDEFNNMLTETAPGPFAGLAGIEVKDYDPQYHKQTTVSGIFGEGTADLWSDIVVPDTAKTLAVYTGDYYAGKACLTKNKYKRGEVYYLGCDLDDASRSNFLKYLCEQSGIPTKLYEIKGVEVVEATDGNLNITFIMNHNDYKVIIPFQRQSVDIISGKTFEDAIELEPYGVLVIR